MFRRRLVAKSLPDAACIDKLPYTNYDYSYVSNSTVCVCLYYCLQCFDAVGWASTTTATRMWANAQPDGRPAEHRWRPLFNAAKFG